MIAATLLAATMSIPTGLSKSPYDVALDYCRDKGGIAQYYDYGDMVAFSCGNDVNEIITIGKE